MAHSLEPGRDSDRQCRRVVAARPRRYHRVPETAHRAVPPGRATHLHESRRAVHADREGGVCTRLPPGIAGRDLSDLGFSCSGAVRARKTTDRALARGRRDLVPRWGARLLSVAPAGGAPGVHELPTQRLRGHDHDRPLLRYGGALRHWMRPHRGAAAGRDDPGGARRCHPAVPHPPTALCHRNRGVSRRDPHAA